MIFIILFILMVWAVFEDALYTFRNEIVAYAKRRTGYKEDFIYMPDPVIYNVKIDTLKCAYKATIDIVNHPKVRFPEYMQEKFAYELAKDMVKKGYMVFTMTEVPTHLSWIPTREYKAYIDLIHPTNYPQRSIRYDSVFEERVWEDLVKFEQ